MNQHKEFRPCKGFNKKGENCRCRALEGSDFCSSHGPDKKLGFRKNKIMGEKTTAVSTCAAPVIAGELHDSVGSATSSCEAEAQIAGDEPETRKSAAHFSFIKSIRENNDDDLLSLRKEMATLKSLHEFFINRLEEFSASGEDALEESMIKKLQGLTMDIISAMEKFAKIEERKKNVLTAEEVNAIIDRVKEMVIHAVTTVKKGDSVEETARRIGEAFGSVEIISGGQGA